MFDNNIGADAWALSGWANEPVTGWERDYRDLDGESHTITVDDRAIGNGWDGRMMKAQKEFSQKLLPSMIESCYVLPSGEQVTVLKPEPAPVPGRWSSLGGQFD